MLRVFQTDLLNTDDFIITLELVPGKEPVGIFRRTSTDDYRLCTAKDVGT